MKLVPAVLWKTEIEGEFLKLFYSKDMMYYNGFDLSSYPLHVREHTDTDSEHVYQFAVVTEKEDALLGFLTYTIDWYSGCVRSFGLISFDKGNPSIGKAVDMTLSSLLKNPMIHRIAWNAVADNPATRAYDKYCERNGGRKIVLRDVFKDRYGKYHDSYIYEIINNNQIKDVNK